MLQEKRVTVLGMVIERPKPIAIISKGLSTNEIHSLESTLTRGYLSEEIALSKSIQKLREKNDLEAMVSL